MVTKLAPVKFASLLMGVWFLANAAANWLAGMLSTLYPAPGTTTSLLGYQITGLADFFMIFVVMGAVASLILFIIDKWLMKLMHGVH
jgi:POT family proton-dependent oligopeptide transporter